VHIEYLGNRQIRTKDWIYTNKGDLIRVNELGRPENQAQSQGDQADVRKLMEEILIDSE
jgi:ribosomal protein S3AE